MIKLVIYYTDHVVFSSAGKIKPKSVYWGNKTKKNPECCSAFNQDKRRLKTLAKKYSGKYNAAILYDMRNSTKGIEIARFNQDGIEI